MRSSEGTAKAEARPGLSGTFFAEEALQRAGQLDRVIRLDHVRQDVPVAQITLPALFGRFPAVGASEIMQRTPLALSRSYSSRFSGSMRGPT